MNFLCTFCAYLYVVALSNAVQIVSRSEWGARSPVANPSRLIEDPPPFVVVHHSETPSCHTTATCKARVRSIQAYHIDHNGWNDIGYNFLIGGDGLVYEGRAWGRIGAHAPRYNTRSIGICVIGSFQDSNPPDIQLNALKDLIASGVSYNQISATYKLIGHRQTKSTTCPGNALFNTIAQWDHFDKNVHP